MKKCSKCLQIKSIDDFYNNNPYWCKDCKRLKNKIWLVNNKQKKVNSDHKYSNSERGYICNLFNGIKKRSKRYGKVKKSSECKITKKEFIEEWLFHKQRFGINCRYTKVPLTYVSNRGYGVQKYKTKTNISVDRIDNTLPYQVNNIAFCSGEFNDRKGSVEIEDCKKILKVYEERKLELKEDGYYEMEF
jgi:hypothetical protein